MAAVQLGPFVLKVEVIIFLLSIIMMFLILKLLLKNDEDFQKKFLDSLFNCLIIAIITFKFSIIIFQPKTFINYPSAVLFYSGGRKGIILGIILAIIYLILKTRREKWPVKNTFTYTFYGVITFLTSYWLFRTVYFIVFT